jgi:hypothetical protein
LSWSFWRGCGAIVVLAGAGFAALVSGSYKNNVTAPTVAPGPAAAVTVVLAAAAFIMLWRWEHRGEDRQR